MDKHESKEFHQWSSSEGSKKKNVFKGSHDASIYKGKCQRRSQNEWWWDFEENLEDYQGEIEMNFKIWLDLILFN